PWGQTPVGFVAFSPKSGSVEPGGSAILTVSVPPVCWGSADPCGLDYVQVGGINVTIPENSYTYAIHVQLWWTNAWSIVAGHVVQPGIRSTPMATASCVASQVNGVFTSLLAGFKATVGLPVPIEVKIADSCGKTMDAGTVVAAFSSGDPPLTLTSIGGGQWTGTWTQRTAAAQATVTVGSVPYRARHDPAEVRLASCSKHKSTIMFDCGKFGVYNWECRPTRAFAPSLNWSPNKNS